MKLYKMYNPKYNISKIYHIHLQGTAVVPTLTPHTAFLSCIRVTHKYKQLQKEEVLNTRSKPTLQ